VKFIVKIDQSKSDFGSGLIVPEGKLESVLIKLKLEDEMIGDHIWYTSLEGLFGHGSVKEFIEEKAPILNKVMIEDRKVLCNGSECKHICYCSYFRHAETTLTKESELKVDVR